MQRNPCGVTGRILLDADGMIQLPDPTKIFFEFLWGYSYPVGTIHLVILDLQARDVVTRHMA